MQYSAPQLVAQLRSEWKILWWVFRLALWVAVVWYCVAHWQASYTPEIRAKLAEILSSSSLAMVLMSVILLMPLNWYLEARRWQCLMGRTTQLSLREAWMGVWMGMAVGTWLPRLLGEYAGRVGGVAASYRAQAVQNVWLGQTTMMASTLAFGLGGVWLYFHPQQISEALLASTVGLFVWPLFLFWGIKFLAKPLSRWQVGKVLPSNVSFGYFRQVQWWSHLRFLVFFLQYWLILSVFLPQLSGWIIAGGIAWVYLAKSAMPFMHMIGDLGVREFSALLFFQAWQVPAASVLTPTLLLWACNVMIPLVLGGIHWLWDRKWN